MMDQEGRESGGGGSRMELAKSKIKFPEVCAPGGLRPRKTGFCFSDPGQGGCWGDAHHRGWEREGGSLAMSGHIADGGFPGLLILTG